MEATGQSLPYLSDPLIAQAAKGDQQAYETLEQQYRPMLTAQVEKAMQSLPPAQQEDCMQIAREAFHSAVCHYDAQKEVFFGHFAKVCVHNAVCSYLRKQKTQARREQAVSQETLYYLPSSAADSPTYRILEQEEWAQWSASLSAFEREVFQRSLQGQKPREIACALCKPPKSVYNALVRIRVKKKNN